MMLSKGNMAAVLAILAKRRGGVTVHKHLLFYPVTDAAFDTESYQAFAETYYLTRGGMQRFWNQYMPDDSERARIEASPLRADESDLAGLPPVMMTFAGSCPAAQRERLRRLRCCGNVFVRAGANLGNVRTHFAFLAHFWEKCRRTLLSRRSFGKNAGALCFPGALLGKMRAHFASPA